MHYKKSALIDSRNDLIILDSGAKLDVLLLDIHGTMTIDPRVVIDNYTQHFTNFGKYILNNERRQLRSILFEGCEPSQYYL